MVVGGMNRQVNGRGAMEWVAAVACAAVLVCSAPPARAATSDGETPADQGRAARIQAGRLVIVAADSLGGRLPGATVLVSRRAHRRESHWCW
jgi:hypothetical protein